MSLILYRAMSHIEAERTIKNQKPDFFKSRFKWFSPDLSFVRSRVMDGKFNNSEFKEDRYTEILKFEVLNPDIRQYFKILNDKEYMLDRRYVQMIYWSDITKI